MTQRPQYVAMTERDRQALRIARAEIAEEDAREEEERMRPLRQAEEEYRRNLNELGKSTRESILTLADPECHKDAATLGIRMTQAQADRNNLEQAELFKQRNPDFYVCPANRDTLLGYMARNKIGAILSADALEAAFKRLREYGLMEERPQPKPEAAPAPRSVAIAPPVDYKPKPETWEGIDLQTGEPRTYSEWDVDRMTSEEFRRAVRLRTVDTVLCKRAW